MRVLQKCAPTRMKRGTGEGLSIIYCKLAAFISFSPFPDVFEKITLYENKAKEASAVENEDGTFTVTMEVEAKKVYSDSLGNQTNTELNDWLEIGVLGETLVNGDMEEIPIYLEKVLITDSLVTFSVQVDQKPIKAGIDPMHKYVDRDSDDNLMHVTFE